MAPSKRHRRSLIRLILAGLPLLLVGWIGTLAIVMRLGGDAPAAFVPFPPEAFTAALPADVAVVGRSPISLTLRSEGADLTRRLYDAGARIVLPAGLEACIPAGFRETVR
ncbi:MAG: hypothetical protein QNJ44_00375 [Rhodobacter sp.]|nr:hypothetical protein [Rhodobacter sp.]